MRDGRLPHVPHPSCSVSSEKFHPTFAVTASEQCLMDEMIVAMKREVVVPSFPARGLKVTTRESIQERCLV